MLMVGDVRRVQASSEIGKWLAQSHFGKSSQLSMGSCGVGSSLVLGGNLW